MAEQGAVRPCESTAPDGSDVCGKSLTLVRGTWWHVAVEGSSATRHEGLRTGQGWD